MTCFSLFDFPLTHFSLYTYLVCCTFGSGGPIELFEGSLDDGVLLFSDPFQGADRLVQSFMIVGSGESGASGQSFFFAILASLIVTSFSLFFEI
jgi:hypothetical protein